MSNDKKPTVCVGCGFAVWNKDQAGRAHRNGAGRCGWTTPEVTLPLAFYYLGHGNKDVVPQPYGGSIHRWRTPHDPAGPCPTYQPKETHE